VTTVDEAYRTAEAVTREQAKNFYYGIRLLPPGKRSALCAVYALARRIDDIGDGDLAPEGKGAELGALRKQIDGLQNSGDSADPVLCGVAAATQRYPVPVSAFGELIDGVQMDIDMDAGASSGYRTFDDLVLYCRRVAGSVGRLCLSIFGSVSPQTSQYADQVGIALQQTNILRDIREDLLNGRIYLPGDELAEFGVTLQVDDFGELCDPEGRLAALIRFNATRAENWYSLGLRLVPHLDRRSAACCLAMAGIYRHLLTRIKDAPASVYDRRLSLSGLQKARVAGAALIGGAL
jgi:phytoene synthase